MDENLAGPLQFREVAEESGLVFQHFIGASGQYYLPEIMGSGVALLDYDLDGDLDVYLLQGTMLDKTSKPEMAQFTLGSEPGNRLFENRILPEGELLFRDVTAKSGLGLEGYFMGVAVGDYDADGDPDLYLTSLGPNVLLRNEGDAIFKQVRGPEDTRWSTSTSFLDYDADGDLDLFFTNYVDFNVRNNKECFSPVGANDYCNPTVYNPVPDRLFRNDGDTFTDVSITAGLGAAFGNGLGVTATDPDSDGWLDLYVANDGTANQVWRNLGNGTFRNQGMLSGAAVNADGQAEAGMGVIAADFDNDGDEDLLLTHNTFETNTLYLNNGKGLYLDATNRYGLGHYSIPFTGFGLSWADFDHDGMLDIFIANGAVTVMEELRGRPYPFQQENQYFKGATNGFEILEGGRVWGELEPQVSRGLATGDIDLDGDLDIVISNNNGPARLYLNKVTETQWLRVKLAGKKSNRKGLGARVGLYFEDGTSIWRRMQRDGSYLSSSEATVHFGLGGSVAIQHLEVHWPGMIKERFPVQEINSTITLAEGTGVDLSE